MADWMKPGNAAVVTGGASGIGRAGAARFLRSGMNVVIADQDKLTSDQAAADLTETARGDGMPVTALCDVSDVPQLFRIQEIAGTSFGPVRCQMNNAGAALPVAAPWEGLDALTATLAKNLMGVVHGCHVFIRSMLRQAERSVIINTGSKQGITRPPGNYAYNLSKAGVPAYTESLAHVFRQQKDCAITAHQLIPGFVYTQMFARRIPEKSRTAWTAEEAIGFMIASLDRRDFYVLCRNNGTPRRVDGKRFLRAAEDIIRNRSALSRWDPAFHAEFNIYFSRKD